MVYTTKANITFTVLIKRNHSGSTDILQLHTYLSQVYILFNIRITMYISTSIGKLKKDEGIRIFNSAFGISYTAKTDYMAHGSLKKTLMQKLSTNESRALICLWKIKPINSCKAFFFHFLSVH